MDGTPGQVWEGLLFPLEAQGQSIPLPSVLLSYSPSWLRNLKITKSAIRTKKKMMTNCVFWLAFFSELHLLMSFFSTSLWSCKQSLVMQEGKMWQPGCSGFQLPLYTNRSVLLLVTSDGMTAIAERACAEKIALKLLKQSSRSMETCN